MGTKEQALLKLFNFLGFYDAMSIRSRDILSLFGTRSFKQDFATITTHGLPVADFGFFMAEKTFVGTTVEFAQFFFEQLLLLINPNTEQNQNGFTTTNQITTTQLTYNPTCLSSPEKPPKCLHSQAPS